MTTKTFFPLCILILRQFHRLLSLLPSCVFAIPCHTTTIMSSNISSSSASSSHTCLHTCSRAAREKRLAKHQPNQLICWGLNGSRGSRSRNIRRRGKNGKYHKTKCFNLSPAREAFFQTRWDTQNYNIIHINTNENVLLLRLIDDGSARYLSRFSLLLSSRPRLRSSSFVAFVVSVLTYCSVVEMENARPIKWIKNIIVIIFTQISIK